ncbi:MAG TPA: helix-turn-helix transcriptional regulator [Azospirillaceae bacterium]|nr:helix-turn-helix transcriptional regulator [Azospirillaceae bacterium]
MSLSHALLTALAEHACSGSELAARFDRSIGYFWPATHQQIYRELAALETAGWVESLPPEPGRGRKRVYRVLPAGLEELRRWVAAPRDPRPIRDEMMVVLRAEAVVGPTGLAPGIEQRLERHREKLELYRRIEARDFAGPGLSREQRLRHLVLRTGIASEMLWIDLCRSALDLLREEEEAPPAGPDGGGP